MDPASCRSLVREQGRAFFSTDSLEMVHDLYVEPPFDPTTAAVTFLVRYRQHVLLDQTRLARRSRAPAQNTIAISLTQWCPQDHICTDPT